MAYTTVPTVIDGDDLTDDFTLAVKAAVDELQAAVPFTTSTWTSPIAGGITVGSGTTAAVYQRIGSIVFAYFKFTLGAGSAITGEITLTLPINSAIQRFAGSAYFFDTSASAQRMGIVAQYAANSLVWLRALDQTPTPYMADAILSSTIPFTWATGDIIVADFWYFV